MDIMCDERDFSGIVLGIVDSNGDSCDIPPSCEGKIVKAPYVDYHEGINLMKKSKFMLLPQVYDASPRVAMEAMSLNIPLLMNGNIVGGWKYINPQTGEFFTGVDDFRNSLSRLMSRLDTYSPMAYVNQHYGKERAGRKLRAFVEEHFGDRVKLPKSNLLIPSEPSRLPKDDNEERIATNQPRVFSVFSTSCSPFQDWQAQALIHNHQQQQISGELVRLMSCDDPNYILPKSSYHKYRVVRVPNFDKEDDSWR